MTVSFHYEGCPQDKLNTATFFEVHVTSQENEQLCIHVL